MLGALGGLTVISMPFAYRVDRRIVPFQWAVATLIMVIYQFGGLP